MEAYFQRDSRITGQETPAKIGASENCYPLGKQKITRSPSSPDFFRPLEHLNYRLTLGEKPRGITFGDLKWFNNVRVPSAPPPLPILYTSTPRWRFTYARLSREWVSGIFAISFCSQLPFAFELLFQFHVLSSSLPFLASTACEWDVTICRN